MKWKIVVDSSCDLRELTFAHTEEIGFAVVSLKIIVGEREFVDEKGLDTEEMLDVMENHHGKTSSSALMLVNGRKHLPTEKMFLPLR